VTTAPITSQLFVLVLLGAVVVWRLLGVLCRWRRPPSVRSWRGCLVSPRRRRPTSDLGAEKAAEKVKAEQEEEAFF